MYYYIMLSEVLYVAIGALESASAISRSLPVTLLVMYEKCIQQSKGQHS